MFEIRKSIRVSQVRISDFPQSSADMSTGGEHSTILVVAGETSGEQHMAGVIEQLRLQNPDRRIEWFGSGGPRMSEQGVEILLDVSELAAIGPAQAAVNLWRYFSFYRRLLREVEKRRPQLAVLVDFPEFNLRLARRLRKRGVPVCCFIGPQVWAWRPSRVNAIRRHVDRMLVILPFEEEFYRSRGVDAVFVGNPVAKLRVLSARSTPPAVADSDIPRVALMPGSRKSEIQEMLFIVLDAARSLRERLPCSFWLVQAPGVSYSYLFKLYREWQERGNPPLPLEIRHEASWRLLPHVDCAIIKSGTSTLEAMVLEVPFAMVYRMSAISYALLRPWVRTDMFCLANLVAGRKIVPEFVQSKARGKDIADYLFDLLNRPSALEEVKQNLKTASEKLGTRHAYAEAARRVAQFLKEDSKR